MKFCKDCRHFKEVEYQGIVEYNNYGFTKEMTNKKRLCLKVEGIEYNPVYGYIINKKDLPTCYELRCKEDNTIYPRCGYEGKWFEPKGEIKS